jgi:hypothetical protein
MILRNATSAGLAAISAFLLSAIPAEAGRRHEPAGDYVVAESRFGHGTVTGAVRNTDLGPQVQLPGGHWEYCRRSCSETLRVQSIDFNEGDDIHIGKGTLGNECGIFGCLEVGIGRRGRY